MIVTIGEIADYINGRAFKPTEWSDAGIPIIRIQNLNDHTKPFNYFEGEFSEKHAIKSGDILLSWSGTPGTSFGCFIWDGPDGVLNQHIFRVDLDEQKCSKEYFVRAVNSKLNLIIEKAHGGVGLKHITKDKLVKIPIPLPPLAEQKRIADLLDAADALRKKDQALLEKYDQLAQSLFLEMFGDPVDVKKNKLGSLITLVGGGTPSKEIESFWNGDIPWASVKDLKSDYLSKTVDSITVEGLKNSTSRIIPSGSLIISTRMAVGKIVICNQDTAINQDLKGILINGDINKIYLFYFLKTKESYFNSVSTGATVKGIKIEHITNLEIPVPSIILQNQFAEQVQLIERQKEIVKKNLAKSKELMKGLMGEVFG
jgi:type I restriction enzyme S subunit